MKLSYKKSGVNYDVLDRVKKLAQIASLETYINNPIGRFKDLKESRGESAYVIESDDSYLAFVQEGLGTKNLIADQMRKITGKTYYNQIAQDTVAMIINDLITVGAKPVSILAYWAVGDSKWFADKKRTKDLIDGWKKSCDLASVTWGAGETPTLKDIIKPETIDLAGAAFGVIKPKKRIVLGINITPGNVIILFESSGIHANGLTLARQLGVNLSDGFATKLPSGNMYGEELLNPTIIYSKLVSDLLDSGINIYYMVNITGHGWRKLMRAKINLSYEIFNIGKVPEIFKFIQEQSNLADKEMYATFNMGTGFAMMVDEKNVNKIIIIANKYKIKAWIGGRVKKGQKEVIIRPLDIIFQSTELNIR